jgi:hypothetical protein
MSSKILNSYFKSTQYSTSIAMGENRLGSMDD